MDRKKIYIAIIVVCFGATGAVLYFSFFSSSSQPSPAPVITNVGTTPSPSSGGPTTALNGDIVYTAPSVFPADSKFDWTLVNSSKYQALIANPPIILDKSEIGRVDPFKDY